jgi:RND family efflux transporter MFP subunit
MIDPREQPLRVPDATHAETEVFDPAAHRPSPGALVKVGAVIVLLLGGLTVAGVVPRLAQRTAMAEDERLAATELPRVRVARAERAPQGKGLSLPGSVQPLQETAIYARANGYVRKWLVDIGAQVKKGQVLVELDVPDVDEELRQAQAAANQAHAAVAQAKSQLEFARTTSKRYTTLAPSGVVSQQEVDQVQSSFDVQMANVAAAEAAHGSALANVHRYEDLKNFGTISAPFDGVVTMRAAEVGQLVTSGTGMGQALFKVAEVDVVRAFVNVPQLYSAGIKVDMDAPVNVREMPGRVFQGKVARTAHELDTATRTLLTEVDIANRDGALMAGMYATVSFAVSRQDHPIIIPATSVVFDQKGTRVAVVRDGVVAWRPVTIDSDFGDRMALSAGVEEGELVAVAATEALLEGARVRPVEAAPADAPGRPAAAPSGSAR